MNEVRTGILVPNRKVKSNRAAMFLEILNICQEFHTLPKAGGLLDQDSLFVYVMRNALNWQAERRELDRHKAEVAAKRR